MIGAFVQHQNAWRLCGCTGCCDDVTWKNMIGALVQHQNAWRPCGCTGCCDGVTWKKYGRVSQFLVWFIHRSDRSFCLQYATVTQSSISLRKTMLNKRPNSSQHNMFLEDTVAGNITSWFPRGGSQENPEKYSVCMKTLEKLGKKRPCLIYTVTQSSISLRKTMLNKRPNSSQHNMFLEDTVAGNLTQQD